LRLLSLVLDWDELRLLEEIRTTPMSNTSIASTIRSIPSLAIATHLESQESIFGSANSAESRLLLTRLEPSQLNRCRSRREIPQEEGI
jgi:hypothetical protein